MNKSTSIHSIVTAQCFTLPNGRVYEAREIEGRINVQIGMYYEDALIGYIHPKRKNNFYIKFNEYGIEFQSIIKYNTVSLYGEKLPTKRVGHLLSYRFVTNNS